MRRFVTIVAVLAWIPSGAQAQSEARRFACEGAGRSEGYPYGVQDTGRKKFRILDDGEHSAVFHLDPTEANFCVTGAVCSVSITADTVQLVVSQVPNYDPLYSSRFQFPRGRRVFEASGGGLDGGWSISGRCKAEPVIGH